jgi:Exopolysaccharide biosynthesis protein related to N-acetylglucosamine-1-phosphodiester alpha-N-acetylglucosaminidase
MKHLARISLFLFSIIFATGYSLSFAQTNTPTISLSITDQRAVDSVAVTSAQWIEKTIAPGIIHLHIHFADKELFSSNQYINILKITRGAGKIEIIPSPLLIETSMLASESGAIAAINGSFFKFNYEYNTQDYNSVDYIRKAGQTLAPNTYPANGMREMHQKGALAIYRGELYILKADMLKSWERYIQADDIITTGPILRTAGTDEELETTSFYTTRHPRTAIAKMANGDILFVTVDGRSVESEGMSLEQLQSTLRWLGAEYIINLDGGGSTAMYIKGALDNGIVNHPTDNRTFDNRGERKVANIIIVK